MDGHLGLSNKEVNKHDTARFKLVLSDLKENSGQTSFIIHATPNISYDAGLKPKEFLQKIGLDYFQDGCQFFRDKCYWKKIAYLERACDGFEHVRQVSAIHEGFRNFAAQIDGLYELVKQADDILHSIHSNLYPSSPFGEPIAIKINPEDIPLWVTDVKFKRLKEIEKDVEKLETERNDLNDYLPLLFADGDILRDAVIKALKFLGLKAESTPQGHTVDILAQTVDGSKKFGFEVTGTGGAIKKDSNKLTQVGDFERTKEHGEKTVLLANTYKLSPIKDRKDKEHFTEPVVNFLSRHPILMMTGYDLYRMVLDTMENNKEKTSLIDILYNTSGVLKY